MCGSPANKTSRCVLHTLKFCPGMQVHVLLSSNAERIDTSIDGDNKDEASWGGDVSLVFSDAGCCSMRPASAV